MTTAEVLTELEQYGNEQTKKTLAKHGAQEPFFGVKVQDLKKILKKTKKNHELSLALYTTGNSDAMYLAGLMADEKQMTKAILNDWVKAAYWHYLSEYTVPWVAADTDFGFELGLEWIKSEKETIAAAGWAALSNWAIVKPDEELDFSQYEELLNQIPEAIKNAPNRVKYTMNGFVITVGCYILPLTEKAKQIGAVLGKVSVDMNGTACKVPLAVDYIEKVIEKGRGGKKKKTSRC